MDISNVAELSQKTNIDSVVQSIIDKFKKRAQFGKEKYGTDLDRKDLDVLDWINHAQEELMDGILYLEKLKKTISTGASQREDIS